MAGKPKKAKRTMPKEVAAIESRVLRDMKKQAPLARKVARQKLDEQSRLLGSMMCANCAAMQERLKAMEDGEKFWKCESNRYLERVVELKVDLHDQKEIVIERDHAAIAFHGQCNLLRRIIEDAITTTKSSQPFCLVLACALWAIMGILISLAVQTNWR